MNHKSQFLVPTKNLALKNTLYVVSSLKVCTCVRFVYVHVHTDECVCLGMRMYTVTEYFCVCKHVALTCCPFSCDICNILCLLKFLRTGCMLCESHIETDVQLYDVLHMVPWFSTGLGIFWGKH